MKRDVFPDYLINKDSTTTIYEKVARIIKFICLTNTNTAINIECSLPEYIGSQLFETRLRAIKEVLRISDIEHVNILADIKRNSGK